jgi:hypothetical protein
MGYIGFTVNKTGQAVAVQSVARSGTDLTVYVQNVGDSPVTVTSVYVDGVLAADGLNLPMDPGATESIPLTGVVSASAPQVTVKVVTTDGNFFEYTKTF